MLALLTYGVQAYSQDNSTAKQFSVAGVVYDDTGEPCIGATVRVKNEPGTGTITDLDGKFAIKVKPGATLQSEYVGMETAQRTILGEVQGSQDQCYRRSGRYWSCVTEEGVSSGCCLYY